MMTIARSALLIATLSFAIGVQAAGTRSAEMLSHTCAGCHGTHGASAGIHMPTIGGLNERYLVSVLNDYKYGLRDSTIMGRIMRGYSDLEIRVIASYFADQPWVANDAVVDGRLATGGRALHEELCETCHRDGGRAQSDERPRLAGQWTGYINYALEVCRERGLRCSPRKMAERVKALSDEELRALAHFYASEK